MEAMRCDRCKKFYVITDKSDERPSWVGKHIFGVRLIDVRDYRLRTYDLCTDCAIEVYNFLNNIPEEANVPISDSCDGCQYELNSANGELCYSCEKVSDKE